MTDDQFDEKLRDIMSERLTGGRGEPTGSERSARERPTTVAPRPTPKREEPMRVVCTDGTAIPCRYYEVTASGVMLFDGWVDGSDAEDSTEGAKRAARERDGAPTARLTGFVPHAHLRYILPPDATAPGAADAAPTADRRPQMQRGVPAPQTGRGQSRRRQPPSGQQPPSGTNLTPPQSDPSPPRSGQSSQSDLSRPRSGRPSSREY